MTSPNDRDSEMYVIWIVGVRKQIRDSRRASRQASRDKLAEALAVREPPALLSQRTRPPTTAHAHALFPVSARRVASFSGRRLRSMNNED